ncbi:MAG: LPS export ABC transporter periplasmic protein LptC, partial [Candidatus Omnitrophica bacterium]|nr:LPS export ABC transporter periplasmic protein LptC [Candidatus Omnitrophota bacterium]
MSKSNVSGMIILLLAVILVSCAGRKEVPPQKTAQEELTQKMQGFSFEGFSEGGKKKWEVAGASAKFLDNKVELKDVSGRTYDGERKVNINAKEGYYIQQEELVHLEKDVVVTTSDGATLSTDSLDWSGKNELVTTDKKVIVTKDNIEIEGKSMAGETQLNQVKLEKDIIVKVKPKTTITCSGPLEVDYKNNMAHFHKDVQLEDERGKVFADEAVVYFNTETKAITKVIATGNVRI